MIRNKLSPNDQILFKFIFSYIVLNILLYTLEIINNNNPINIFIEFIKM